MRTEQAENFSMISAVSERSLSLKFIRLFREKLLSHRVTEQPELHHLPAINNLK